MCVCRVVDAFLGAQRSALEAVEEAAKIIEFRVRAGLVAGAAAEFIEDLPGAAIDIFALEQVFLRANPAIAARFAAEGVAAGVGVGFSELLAFLALSRLVLLLLRERFAEISHALAQRFDGLRLIVEGASEILLAKGLFGLVHGAPGAAQILTRGLPFRRASAGEILSLSVQLLPERALAVG